MAWTNEQIVYTADGTPKAEQPADTSTYTLLEGEYLVSAGDQSRYTAGAVTPEGNNDSGLERTRAEEAAEGGVRDARFLGYAEVLANYANRSDVETLAERRARHLGYDPAQQSFTRAAEYDAGAGTAKNPQTTYPDVAEADEWTEEEFPPVTP